MGFGIMASVVTNNVAALAALANGVLPLRKVAQIEAERRHRLEMTQSHAMERNAVQAAPPAADRRGHARGDQHASSRDVGMRSRVPTELHWHAEKPQFTIRSEWLSFVVHFTHEVLVVDAELTLAAKMLATKENRETP